ncbi:isoquinoline 1-oxidoreductase alpha subunit [Aquimarina sp. MAR_2010_214]|uniref:(2Fe-2S)-binding protein n=1 Tax=Aquimarina sp. MAR_2010_214 TaxID=1250026 RepID=UPI000C6FEE6D|nr:(2Fe-2S)-binding protein [Aquimarina sp. MAR_2010_214]PKV49089.1 isoquinoline 1-oxidoreductase alpha subunit [Aquimarina sp. MAR_2010_214]
MTLNINNQDHTFEADANMPLLWVLRDLLEMTGTKYACGIGQCGACTVLVDGKAARSCSIPITSALGKKITTIEHSEPNSLLRSLKDAWVENDTPQCGYCQSGQIMNALALLKQNPNPTEEEIELGMRGNICRCGTYPRIKKSIQLVIQKNKKL